MPELIQTNDYTGPERRRYSKTLEQLEADIKQDMRQVISDHEERENGWRKELLQQFSRAFPDGDIEGHCDAHEAMIKAHQAQEQFWKTITTAVVNKGVSTLFDVIKWVLIFAVIGFLFNIGLGGLAAKLAAVATGGGG